MKADVLEHLRRNHERCQLPGGREGVRVLVQYAGQVPATTRRDRQVWLEKRFTELASDLGELGVQIQGNPVSGSAQTVTAIVPVDQYDRADAQLSHWGCRAIVDYRDQVAW